MPAVGGCPAKDDGRRLLDGDGAVRGQEEQAALRVDGMAEKTDGRRSGPHALVGVDPQPEASEEALDRAERVDRLGLRRRLAAFRRRGAAKIVHVCDHTKAFSTEALDDRSADFGPRVWGDPQPKRHRQWDEDAAAQLEGQVEGVLRPEKEVVVGVGDVPNQHRVRRPEHLGEVGQRLVATGPLRHEAVRVAIVDDRPLRTAARPHDKGGRKDLDAPLLHRVRHLLQVPEVQLPLDLARHEGRVGCRGGVRAGAPRRGSARPRDLHPVGDRVQHPGARAQRAPLWERAAHAMGRAVPNGHFCLQGGQTGSGTRRRRSRPRRRRDRGARGHVRRGRWRPR